MPIPDPSAGGWFDAHGCLTPAGIARLGRIPPGQAPPDVAQHLASCPRCQTQLLSGGIARRQVTRRPILRLAVGALLGLLLLISALLALRILAR